MKSLAISLACNAALKWWTCLGACIGVWFLSAKPLVAADAGNVRRLFAKHCFECHGADAEKGRLRLDLLPP
jgi:mono/diheme cytochrome c family protein